jgi:GTP-sensing pleiotropic transcriptional regulator CodY
VAGKPAGEKGQRSERGSLYHFASSVLPISHDQWAGCEAFEQLLSDEKIRENFYERLSAYAKTLAIAMSSEEFITTTPENRFKAYKAGRQTLVWIEFGVRPDSGACISAANLPVSCQGSAPWR